MDKKSFDCLKYCSLGQLTDIRNLPVNPKSPYINRSKVYYLKFYDIIYKTKDWQEVFDYYIFKYCSLGQLTDRRNLPVTPKEPAL